MKKGMFSMMNYLLPLNGMASMHCRLMLEKMAIRLFSLVYLVPVKQHLSTDPKRQLIGDDEHGWDDNGVFNFEGGCYAKTVNVKC